MKKVQRKERAQNSINKIVGGRKMAKVDKDYKLRMEGYVAALRFAKEHGIEELEKDVKRRGFYQIPIQISKKELDNFIFKMSRTLTQTLQAVYLRVLNEKFGFGKKRLTTVRDEVSKATEMVFKFDYLGEHYVTLEDYAVWLNKKYDLGLDVELIAASQDSCRHERQNRRMADVDVLVQRLHEYGFHDAADWMERKVE